jgi:hypothetical protein
MLETLSPLLEPFRIKIHFLEQVFPRLFAAAVVFFSAWCVAGIARAIARRAVRAVWLEALLSRSGLLSNLVDPSLFEPRRLVISALYWAILLTGAALGLAILNEDLALRLAEEIAIGMPRILTASLVLIASFWLGRYWSRSTLIWLTNEGVAMPWRWASLVRVSVIAIGVALASELTGFASALIRPAFLILFAGVVFSLTYALLPTLRLQVMEFLDDPRRRKPRTYSDDPLLR